MNDYTGLGRDELIRIIEKLTKERDSYLINLTSVQTRCTELLGSLRNAKATVRDERGQRGPCGAVLKDRDAREPDCVCLLVHGHNLDVGHYDPYTRTSWTA